jgi:Zn-dependent protease
MNFKLATFFGIPLKLNIFTLLFIVWVYLTNSNEFIDGLPIKVNLFATITFCIMLVFVIMHEYGHCLMARRLGENVIDITIYPLGGIARMESAKYSPKNEILITAAGPLVNLALAFLFAIATIVTFMINQDAIAAIVSFFVFMMMNLILFIFNLLPIFPMDGGRLLRACLAYRMGYEKATKFTVKFSQILGLILIGVCFFYEFYLTGVLLGFVVLAAQKEVTAASIVGNLQEVRRKAAIILNNPELEKCSLAELILAFKAVEDEETKQKLQMEELLPILESFNHEKTAI